MCLQQKKVISIYWKKRETENERKHRLKEEKKVTKTKQRSISRNEPCLTPQQNSSVWISTNSREAFSTHSSSHSRWSTGLLYCVEIFLLHTLSDAGKTVENASKFLLEYWNLKTKRIRDDQRRRIEHFWGNFKVYFLVCLLSVLSKVSLSSISSSSSHVSIARLLMNSLIPSLNIFGLHKTTKEEGNEKRTNVKMKFDFLWNFSFEKRKREMNNSFGRVDGPDHRKIRKVSHIMNDQIWKYPRSTKMFPAWKLVFREFEDSSWTSRYQR